MRWQLKALKALRRQLPSLSAPVRPKPGSLPNRVRKLKEDEAHDVITAYQAGATVYELQHRFGIARQTISKILKHHGIRLRRTGLYPAEIDEAARLYQQGWTLAQLGERLLASPETSRIRLIERGVQLRPRGPATDDSGSR